MTIIIFPSKTIFHIIVHFFAKFLAIFFPSSPFFKKKKILAFTMIFWFLSVFRPVPIDHELVQIGANHIEQLFSQKSVQLPNEIVYTEYQLNQTFQTRLTIKDFGKFTVNVIPYHDQDRVTLLNVEPLGNYSPSIKEDAWILQDPNKIKKEKIESIKDFLDRSDYELTIGKIIGYALKITSKGKLNEVFFFIPEPQLFGESYILKYSTGESEPSLIDFRTRSIY